MSRTRILIGIALFVVLTAIVLLVTMRDPSSGLSGKPAHVRVLRWASPGDAPTLDPHGSSNTFALTFLGNVYEPLVRLDNDMRLEPALAERWELITPTRWRFHLRRGVRFHNGNAFDADDVLFSYARVANEYSILRDRVATVADVVKIDDHTVDFVTSQPNPILPNLWTSLYIMDREWSEQHGASVPPSTAKGASAYASHHENGTGPFRVVERDPEIRTVFEPFRQWWGRPAHNLDRVVFTPIAHDGTRVAALLSGEIDMMAAVPIQDVDRIDGGAHTRVLIRPELRTMFLGMDQFRTQGLGTDVVGNPFLDRRVRLAVAHAIDYQGLGERIMRGTSHAASTMIAPELFPDAARISPYAHDPVLSRRLLAEAGYPRGFRTRMVCPNDRYVNDKLICQAISAMLARIGVTVDLQTSPMNQYSKNIGRPTQDFALYLLGWTPAGLDSYNVLFNLMGSWDRKTGRGNINYGGFSNPRIDAIAAAVASETDKVRRDALILEAFGILHDNGYYIPLHQQPVIWAASDRTTVVQRADDAFFFKDSRIAD